MPYKVYLVEDNEDLNAILKKYLEKEGYCVEAFLDGYTAQKWLHTSPDLWILDIMLPDINGYTLLKEIKEVQPNVPIIFISAKNEEIDRVIGLELGCDDYISKPFLPRELIIKAKKWLELTYGVKPAYNKTTTISGYVINRESHTIRENDVTLSLSAKEFDLLLFFIDNPNQAFSREQILERIWDKHYYGSDRVVDDTIRRIRKKLPNLPLETMYGYGYRLVKK
ncbi:DNA-binding response regulator [Brevibacillus fluminis]|uniref:DNA-binding response regulator n=1 Tax=Brevibacillus fluminis TaxID=511487 RepID=A0A3M8DWD0_9BACL|nr:response regulator transcription factor [Brevibacillus fluminis]RNB92402.1 DNA-binding response regulator [Brevibacillus fluminis]